MEPWMVIGAVTVYLLIGVGYCSADDPGPKTPFGAGLFWPAWIVIRVGGKFAKIGR